jgi:hypothetical protein
LLVLFLVVAMKPVAARAAPFGGWTSSSRSFVALCRRVIARADDTPRRLTRFQRP